METKSYHSCHIFLFFFVFLCVLLLSINITIVFFSLSEHKANTTELHPKVRQTCHYHIRLCLMLMSSNRSSTSHISCPHCSLPNIVHIGVLWVGARTDQYSLSAASHRILQVDRVSVQAPGTRQPPHR